MKFVPVSENEFKEIVELFHSDLGVQTIMQKYNRDFYTIKKIWLTCFNEAQFRARTSRLCKIHKIGKKNPMYGKAGPQHHNAIEKCIDNNGYIQVFAPEWYQGATDGSRTLEHIVTYCEYNGLSVIPKGMVVHHLDENKQNNSPENLILLSIPDHRRIHAWLNKVQRLSQEGVGNSVSEAQGT